MRRPGEGRRDGRAGNLSILLETRLAMSRRDLAGPGRGDLRARAVARSLRVLNENRAEREQTRVALFSSLRKHERPPERVHVRCAIEHPRRGVWQQADGPALAECV